MKLFLLFAAFEYSLCYSFIVTVKEGHSVEQFNMILDSLVLNGAVITHDFKLFRGAAIEVPEKLLPIFKALDKVIEIEGGETSVKMKNE